MENTTDRTDNEKKYTRKYWNNALIDIKLMHWTMISTKWGFQLIRHGFRNIFCVSREGRKGSTRVKGQYTVFTIATNL